MNVKELRTALKSKEYDDLLGSVVGLLNQNNSIRKGEVVSSIMPYSRGFNITIQGKEHEQRIPWNIPVENGNREYFTYEVRTLHVWWRELERYLETQQKEDEGLHNR